MKQRIINTRFWDDTYVSDLDPIEKLLFLYLLTNTSTNISGIYEIPLKKIANETGIDKEMVIKVIDRFSDDKRIFYLKGWVCIKNFIKHQNQRSPKVQKGIENEIMAVPKDILSKFIEYGYGIDTLSHLNLNSNTNSNLNTKVKSEETSQDNLIPEIIKSFEKVNPTCKTYYGNKTQRKACQFLIDEYGFEKVKDVIEKVLPKIKGMEFFPTITTPVQLKEKWSALENAVKRKQLENKTNIAFV